MKKTYILFISLFALLLCGCSKDYLNTAPTSSISGSAVFESADNMKMAINGLNRLLRKQWFSSQGWNGQGTTMLYYGEYPGDELTVYLTGWTNTICGKYHDSSTSTYDYHPWHVYYMIIGNANSIIENVEKASGLQTDLDYIHAQALTYRAYAYYYLSQLYGRRWVDAGAPESKAVVLRLDTSTGDQPLCTLSELYDQIYADLDEAISLYNKSYDRKSTDVMGKDVAYAIYSRIALAKQDWKKAYDMSKAVIDSKGYSLMSVDEYRKGFCHANNEWIWYLVGNEQEDLYYYSFAAYVGWNVQASQCRTYPKCMSKQIYTQIPTTDIRKKMFLDPDNPYYGEAPETPSKISYTAASGKISATASVNLAYQYAKDVDFLNGHAGFPLTTFTPYIYMQFKFAKDSKVVGTAITDVPLMRLSEMYLNAAEAACMQGNVTEAKKLMTELVKNTNRDPEYDNSNISGQQAMLDHIKLYTKIELWGEGFNWFNIKRWNDTIHRISIQATGDDKGKGSWFAAVALDIAPSDVNNQTWVVPQKEKDYNHAI